MSGHEDLAARIRVLEDIEAIRQLKARYFHAIDRQDWDRLASCFGPGSAWVSERRKVRIEGADAIVRFIRGIEEGEHIVNTHHGHDPEITITGADRATGLWETFHYREDRKQRQILRSAVFYEDTYVREGGTWKIGTCKVVPIYFHVTPLATDP